MASSNPPSSSEAGAATAGGGSVAVADDEKGNDASAVAPGGSRAASNRAHEPRGAALQVPTTAPPQPPPPPAPLRPLLPPSTYGTVFTNAKAGMEQVDFDHVKKVVYEASANSLHGAHQARRDAQLAARVDALRGRASRLARLEPGRVAAAERAADALASRLLHARDRGRSWVCLDMDAFFFSVEARDDPERLLPAADGGRGPPRPFAVGSTSMITTANGEARKYGVRSAMPGYIALRLCPHLEFVPLHFDKYVAASKQVMACLPRFDPRFEPSGLDEAFVEVTDYVRRRRMEEEGAASAPRSEGGGGFSALDAANEIRAAVRAATSLPCSAGVAPNRMLAKMASDLGKPDGAFAVPRDPAALAAFVAETGVRKVPGIGRVTERVLEGALGVRTCAQLYANRGLVFCLFGKATAEFLLAASLGAGSDEHSGGEGGGDGEGGGGGGGGGEHHHHQRKGLSAERTFTPTSELSFIDAKLSEIAERVAEGVRAEGLRPRTLTLKVKMATFDVITRAASAGGGGGGGGGNGSSHGVPAVSSVCAGISSFIDAGRIAAVAAALFRAECLNFSSSSSSSAAAAAAAAAAPQSKEREKTKRGNGCPPPVRLLGIRLSNWENAVVPVERGQKRLDDVLAAAMRKETGGGTEAEADADADAEAAAPLVPAAAENKPSSSSSRPSCPPPPPPCSTWTCSLCTYAETRNFSLRCDVCGTPRGATGCGSLLAEGAVAEERAVAGGRSSSSSSWSSRDQQARTQKRPLASSAALDAFFVRKK